MLARAAKECVIARTVHELLVFHLILKPRDVTLQMHPKNVKTRASVVAFNGRWPRNVLHGKVITH